MLLPCEQGNCGHSEGRRTTDGGLIGATHLFAVTASDNIVVSGHALAPWVRGLSAE